MSLHITDKEVQKQIKQFGYKGCKNCQHQIAPLRMCRWAEQGGDGHVHFICPMWDKAEKVIKLRDATSEEQKSVNDYIESISKPTGVDFWNLDQELSVDAVRGEK